MAAQAPPPPFSQGALSLPQCLEPRGEATGTGILSWGKWLPGLLIGSSERGSGSRVTSLTGGGLRHGLREH
jgi:hypothetical protein